MTTLLDEVPGTQEQTARDSITWEELLGLCPHIPKHTIRHWTQRNCPPIGHPINSWPADPDSSRRRLYDRVECERASRMRSYAAACPKGKYHSGGRTMICLDTLAQEVHKRLDHLRLNGKAEDEPIEGRRCTTAWSTPLGRRIYFESEWFHDKPREKHFIDAKDLEAFKSRRRDTSLEPARPQNTLGFKDSEGTWFLRTLFGKGHVVTISDVESGACPRSLLGETLGGFKLTEAVVRRIIRDDATALKRVPMSDAPERPGNLKSRYMHFLSQQKCSKALLEKPKWARKPTTAADTAHRTKLPRRPKATPETRRIATEKNSKIGTPVWEIAKANGRTRGAVAHTLRAQGYKVEKHTGYRANGLPVPNMLFVIGTAPDKPLVDRHSFYNRIFQFEKGGPEWCTQYTAMRLGNPALEEALITSTDLLHLVEKGQIEMWEREVECWPDVKLYRVSDLRAHGEKLNGKVTAASANAPTHTTEQAPPAAAPAAEPAADDPSAVAAQLQKSERRVKLFKAFAQLCAFKYADRKSFEAAAHTANPKSSLENFKPALKWLKKRKLLEWESRGAAGGHWISQFGASVYAAMG